jgi:hypothetical protein
MSKQAQDKSRSLLQRYLGKKLPEKVVVMLVGRLTEKGGMMLIGFVLSFFTIGVNHDFSPPDSLPGNLENCNIDNWAEVQDES